MKMRFDTRCAKCRKDLRFGTRAVHIYGGYWHQNCYMDYRRGRQAAMQGGKK